ncbi:MAG: 2'-5' RNA ligase family protein [Pseudomonadota bacterium]|nr:2'-5' RNA ligase family protein [Pseudomonadota bacterium]
MAAAVSERPLILTLKLDEGSFDWFQALRTEWFPPERNLVPAHLTLFHALPGAELGPVRRTVRDVCARTAPMTLHGGGFLRWGHGVAYSLHARALNVFRAELADAFAPWLTRQDQRPFQPHITVQNKVAQLEAKALLERLQAEWEPFDGGGEGVLLWRYQRGPWEALDEVAFGGPARA